MTKQELEAKLDATLMISREALAPFAEAYNKLEADFRATRHRAYAPDNVKVGCGELSIGDFRRARAALDTI